MGIIRDYLCPIKIKSKLDKLKNISVQSKAFSRFKYGNHLIYDLLKNIIPNSNTLFNSFRYYSAILTYCFDYKKSKLTKLYKFLSCSI